MCYEKLMENFDIYRIDGHTLRIFLSVCRTGSVSKTAEEFDLNQSTISHSLDKLRACIGDPLFVRSGRGIMATQAALDLKPRVQQVLAGIEGLPARQDYVPKLDTNPITIAVNATELLDELTQIRDEIWCAAPDTPVRFLDVGSRGNVGGLLEATSADLALMTRMPNYPTNLAHKRILTDRFVTFFDPDVREAVLDEASYMAARHGALDFGGARPSLVQSALVDRPVERTIALRASNSYVLAEMVRGTDILVTLQSRLAKSAFRGFAKCEPPIDIPPVQFDMIWHRRYENAGRSRWLRAVVSGVSARLERDAVGQQGDAATVDSARLPV